MLNSNYDLEDVSIGNDEYVYRLLFFSEKSTVTPPSRTVPIWDTRTVIVCPTAPPSISSSEPTSIPSLLGVRSPFPVAEEYAEQYNWLKDYDLEDVSIV